MSEQSSMSRTDENFAKVHQNMHENHQLTARSITQQAIIERETVIKIVTENFDMRKWQIKTVPKQLTDEKKQGRVEIYKDRFERQDHILSHVITDDIIGLAVMTETE